MASLVLGTMAYACAACFDLAALAGNKNLKRSAGMAALVAFTVAFIWAIKTGPTLAVPRLLSILSWPLIVLGAALLLYSLFLEIPFTVTYVSHNAPSAIVRTGTYALCRHPGVLWMGLFLIGAALASASRTMLWAALLWWAVDFLYAWWQDRWLFPRQFPEYRVYQREAPMFIPTRASMARCLATLGHRLPGA
jgi:protein-S-isoprenylcysteine O-methyltransferase Ste14